MTVVSLAALLQLVSWRRLGWHPIFPGVVCGDPVWVVWLKVMNSTLAGLNLTALELNSTEEAYKTVGVPTLGVCQPFSTRSLSSIRQSERPCELSGDICVRPGVRAPGERRLC